MLYRVADVPISARSPGLFGPDGWESFFLKRCQVCGHPKYKDRRFPAWVKFQGSNPMDIHDTGGIFVARKSVGEELAENFPELEVHEIELRNKSKHVFSESYVEIHSTLNVDQFRSDTVICKVNGDCGHCGWRSFYFQTVERMETFDDGHGELDFRIVRERPATEGIILRQCDVGEARIFRFMIGYLFCTEEFKQFVEDKGYTNVYFTEVGVISDDLYADKELRCPR